MDDWAVHVCSMGIRGGGSLFACLELPRSIALNFELYTKCMVLPRGVCWWCLVGVWLCGLWPPPLTFGVHPSFGLYS
jgi:hypothetical protein